MLTKIGRYLPTYLPTFRVEKQISHQIFVIALENLVFYIWIRIRIGEKPGYGPVKNVYGPETMHTSTVCQDMKVLLRPYLEQIGPFLKRKLFSSNIPIRGFSFRDFRYFCYFNICIVPHCSASGFYIGTGTHLLTYSNVRYLCTYTGIYLFQIYNC